MTRIPTDSADVAELREQQEAIAADANRRQVEHTTRCRDGWLGEDGAGRVVPCLVCRPHLQPEARA